MLLISHVGCNVIQKPDTDIGPRMLTRTNHRNETYVMMVHESEKATFSEAEARCSVIGSMVWMRDEADQRFVHSLLGGHKAWLASRFTQGLLSSGKLTITDPVSRTSSFENWKQNEPRCSAFGECCAIMMDENGKWLAFPCSSKAHILCRVKKSFQVEADKLIQDTKNAILENGGTVPPDFGVREREKEDAWNNNQVLSNLTQRLTTLEQQVLDIRSSYKQMMDDKYQQAVQHSDENSDRLSRKIANMTNDFNGSIDSLTKLLIKRNG